MGDYHRDARRVLISITDGSVTGVARKALAVLGSEASAPTIPFYDLKTSLNQEINPEVRFPVTDGAATLRRGASIVFSLSAPRVRARVPGTAL